MNNDRCSGMSAYVVACIYWIHIDRLWERGLRFAQRHRGGRRGTEGRINNIRIWHTLLYYIISLGYRWNRVAGGELLHSSLHRGSTQCEAVGSFSVETAVKQPALSPLFRPHPNHRKKVQSNAKLRYSLYIPLCEKAGLSRRLRPPLCLCARRIPVPRLPSMDTVL